MMKALLFAALLSLVQVPALAQSRQMEVPLAQQAQEQRAREIFHQLRCEVCEGQTIADSNAVLAQDMRMLVRQRVEEGQSDEAILTYFADRYGRDILMRPPMDASTAPLWIAPLFMLVLGGWFVIRYFSRRKDSHI